MLCLLESREGVAFSCSGVFLLLANWMELRGNWVSNYSRVTSSRLSLDLLSFRKIEHETLAIGVTSRGIYIHVIRRRCRCRSCLLQHTILGGMTHRDKTLHLTTDQAGNASPSLRVHSHDMRRHSTGRLQCKCLRKYTCHGIGRPPRPKPEEIGMWAGRTTRWAQLCRVALSPKIVWTGHQ